MKELSKFIEFNRILRGGISQKISINVSTIQSIEPYQEHTSITFSRSNNETGRVTVIETYEQVKAQLQKY